MKTILEVRTKIIYQIVSKSMKAKQILWAKPKFAIELVKVIRGPRSLNEVCKKNLLILLLILKFIKSRVKIELIILLLQILFLFIGKCSEKTFLHSLILLMMCMA